MSLSRDLAIYWSRIGDFYLPNLHFTPLLGVISVEFHQYQSLAAENVNSLPDRQTDVREAMMEYTAL